MRIKTTAAVLLSFLCFHFTSKAAGDTSTVSAKSILKLARAYSDQLFFEQAENTYNLYLNKDTTNSDVYYELGMMEFTFMFKREEAITNLERFIRHSKSKKDTLPEVCNALGKSYQFVENYDKALEFYESFIRKLQNNEGGILLKKEANFAIEQCMFAQDHTKPTKGIVCSNLGAGVNTAFPEFDPVPLESDNNLFFTTMRFGQKTEGKTVDEEALQSIYVATKKKGSFEKAHHYRIFDSLEIGRTNIAAGSISPDNSKFYVSKDERLYVSSGKDTTWGMPVMMSDTVNSGFSQNHAMVTPDGQTLYFAANITGGFGGLDIYRCELSKNGSWGAPINLGKTINTPQDEDGPFVSADGKTLYFASKGLVGFGGFDIFKSDIHDKNLSTPVNMGRPYNSSADDLFLKFNKAGDVGYLSSGRIKGYGDMDIYRVTKVVDIDCKLLKNKTAYPVSFDASKSIDPKGVKLSYEWDMADGTKEHGIKFTHVYKRPGDYDVILTTKDSISGRVEKNEAVFPVTFKNASHIEFVSADTVYQNEEVNLDASSSVIPSKTPVKYAWKINDTEFGKGGSMSSYTFKNSGRFNLKVQIDFKCTNCKENESYCYSKVITVLEGNRRDKQKK